MAYNKQQWKDEIPDLTKPIKDSSGKQKTDPQTGRPLYELVQEGTRLTSQRLNHIEDGIEIVHELTDQNAADIDTHKKDTVKHITAAERAEWKAKETLAGAQTKADAALSAAKTYADTALLAKADKSSTYSKTETDQRIQAVVGAAPDALDTLKEIGDALNNDPNFAATVTNQLSGKVDKVAGKQLSTEDYSSSEKAKLAGLTPGAGGAGSATDATIGNRTADPSITTPYSLTGTITQWFSWLTKYLKSITGKANPFDTPDITLAATKTHVDDTTRHITATERTAWNAAESNAKNASIPKTEKGAASGVAAMDATSKVPRVNTYSSLGGAGGATNLNTLYTAGTYSVTNTATGAPEANYGQVIVHVSSGDTHDNVANWIWQMFFSTIGPIYVRRKINEKEWQEWVPLWTGYNDSPVFMPRARITNNTDFNTLLTNGIWSIYMPTGITNAPAVTYGLLFVYVSDKSTTYVKQEVIDVTNGNTYIRARSSVAVWSAWKLSETTDKKNTANGYAGLDANTKLLDAHIPASIARTSQIIPANTDLNAFRNEGDYFCPSNATAATILNMPTAIAGQSFYLRNNTHAGVNQSIISYNSASFRIYTRNYYSPGSPQWSDWMEIEHSGRKNVASGYAGLDASIRVPRNNVYNSLGGANTIPTVDLDLALTAGVYPISPVTLNKPAASMWGQVLVFISGAETHNNANTWTWQLLLQSSGGSYVRFKDAAAAWSTWVPWWTGNNDSPFIRDRGLIANATNFNNIVTSGLYAMFQEPPITYVNSPLVNYGLLQVSRVDHNGTFYIKQEVIDVISGAIYTRGRSGTSAIWTAWVSSISSAGGNFTGPVSRTYSSESVKLSNVASYKGNINNTGAIKITLPVGWNATMMTIKITGYEYASNRGAWELIIGGYNFTGGWMMTSALADSAAGSLPFTSVRLAYDGTKCCILLGTTTNVSQYPHIEVTEVLASHNGASALASAGNWTITNITSETGITNAVIVPIKWGNADTLSGWSPSQAPTPNTVVVRNSKGEIPGITSTAAKVEDLPVANSTSGVPVLAYTPTADETITVLVYLSLLYDTKISIYVQYVDPRLGLTAYEFLPVSATPAPYDGYVFVPAFIRVKANETVSLLVTHNNTTNPAYVTAAIRRE
ncbi:MULTISPECIES: pyocin knob domain-containing protein [Paenibacillus]|uniref:pyocin knob domain-containing protein n=1 Tax=Paenibacillus TaxID=44249 RepID=UPI0015C3DD30|nr:pyocin knob domain-containing protein [Paenibacillus odorifer]